MLVLLKSRRARDWVVASEKMAEARSFKVEVEL